MDNLNNGYYYRQPPSTHWCPGIEGLPFPDGVRCPYNSEISNFHTYRTDANLRDQLIQIQQNGDGGFSSNYHKATIGCNPPITQIQACMNKKVWTTMLSPDGFGGSRARLVYMNLLDQRDPDPQRCVVGGHEIAFIPNPTGGSSLVFGNLAEYGGNICAIFPC